MPTKLDETVIRSELEAHNDWTLRPDGLAISKRFAFKNFSQAFAFMTRVAMASEKLDHHPEWSNIYGTVDVTLTTHSAGGVTELDFKMVAMIEKFAES